MASRRFRNSIVVSEEFRIHAESEIRSFVLNDSAYAHEFPPTLSNIQRAWIHNYIKNYSLLSKSYGKEPERKLVISKKRIVTIQNASQLKLSKDIRKLIHAFLCKFPLHKDPIDMTYIQSCTAKLNNMEPNVGQLSYGIPQLPAFGLNPALWEFRTNLPIFKLRQEIVETILTNQVVIIRGETGSGKTTQIPQFILDYSACCDEVCRIVCTQPRRISAISVANRVSDERAEKTGGGIGYHIRLESCVGPKTSLIYCTNGVLLRTLMNGDDCLSSITHIIVDEIHERDRYSDFLLICLRECLVTFPHLRLILMSATLDVSTFVNYFNNAPSIYVPGRLFDVYNYYLDDILTLIRYESPAMKNYKPLVNHTLTNELLDNLRAEMDDCIADYFSTGSEESINLLMQLILNENVPINYRHSKTGCTSLMAAASQGHYTICLELLQLGANTKLRCFEQNWTASDWAFAKLHINIYDLLKAHENNGTNNVPALSGIYCTQEMKQKLILYQKTVSDQTIDFDLLLSVLFHIHTTNGPGGILVFLAGYDDIAIVKDRILHNEKFRKYPYEIFTLHGMMQTTDQNKVFQPLRNKRKIILSTNIAETSITIDDVVYVIDSGKVKEKTYDALTGICSLQSNWISQSAAKQRAGRAGRTQDGFCFHLFSRVRNSFLPKYPTPEMLRMPLHELCLQTKLLAPLNVRIGDFLCRALEPPSSMAVKNSITHLQDIKALNNDEDLTILGRHLVDLPVEPRLAKMLIYSVIFRCLDPILTIVAFLSYRDPFMLPNNPQEKNIAMALRKLFSVNTFSDHMILLKVFQAWQDARLASQERMFCAKHYVSSATMDMVVKIRAQLLAQLRAAGFVSTKPPGDIRDLNDHSNNWAVIKAVLAAGFLPNMAYIDRETMKIGTMKEKKVSVHISSCLRSNEHNNNNVEYIKKIPTNWLIYEELSRVNTNHNIRSVTCVSPLTVVLFSDDVNLTHGYTLENELPSQKWITMTTSNESINLIKSLRIKLNNLIGKKIMYPQKNNSYHDNSLLQTFASLLQKEDEMLGLHQPAGVGQRPKIVNCNNSANNENHIFMGLYKPLNDEEKHVIEKFLSFKKINPAYYNKYIPQTILVPNDEETEGHNFNDDLQNLVHSVENVDIQNPLTSDVKILEYSEDENDFENNGALVEYDEACSLESHGPLWMEQVYNPNWTTFCLINTGTTRSIEVSISKKVWVFPPYIEKKLKRLFETGKQILLVFSVQNSHSFQAIARLTKIPMIEEINYSIQSSLEWISRADVNFTLVQRFFPDQFSDGDQLPFEFGIQLWELFTTLAPPNIHTTEPVRIGIGRPITKRVS